MMTTMMKQVEVKKGRDKTGILLIKNSHTVHAVWQSPKYNVILLFSFLYVLEKGWRNNDLETLETQDLAAIRKLQTFAAFTVFCKVGDETLNFCSSEHVLMGTYNFAKISPPAQILWHRGQPIHLG